MAEVVAYAPLLPVMLEELHEIGKYATSPHTSTSWQVRGFPLEVRILALALAKLFSFLPLFSMAPHRQLPAHTLKEMSIHNTRVKSTSSERIIQIFCKRRNTRFSAMVLNDPMLHCLAFLLANYR